MATIIESSLIRTDTGLNADSSDITRVYTDNGVTINHGTGAVTTDVANSSNFSNTFTESDPFHLNVNSIQQTSGNGLTLENGTIVYLQGPTTLPPSDATIQNSGVNNFRNITWLAANGAAGDFWGWGIRGTGSAATGETTNCRFLSVDGTPWFINLENSNGAYIFANNDLTDAVLNTALAGNVVDGLSFGDAIRFQSHLSHEIGYSMRVQSEPNRNATIINNTFNSTNYNTGASTIGRGHYQVTFDNGTITLINERHATNDIFVSAFGASTRSSDIFVNYAWNPQFRDGSTNADILDTRLLNVTDTLTKRVPANSSNLVLYDTLYPAITNGETPMEASRNGYIVQTIDHDAAIVNSNAVSIGSRALDLDGNLVATPKTYNVKSYTHNLPTTVTTGTTGQPVDQITNAGGPTGSFGWTTEDIITGASDTNVLTNDTVANIAAYDGSAAAHITPRALYSRTKAVWYGGALLENFGTTVSTATTGLMAFQKPLTFTSTAGAATVTDSLVTVPVSNATGIVGDDFFNAISSTGNITCGVNIDGINLSATNLVLNGSAANGSLVGTTMVNLNNNNTTGSISFETPIINNWSTTATHGFTTVNGVTTLNLTGLNASNNGTVRLTSIIDLDDTVGTGDITINAPTADNAGLTGITLETNNPRVKGGTNVTVIPLVFKLTVSPQDTALHGFMAATVDGVLTTGGIQAVGGGADVQIELDNTLTVGSIIRLYYKPFSNNANSYYTTFHESFAWETLAEDEVILLAPSVIPPALVAVPDTTTTSSRQTTELYVKSPGVMALRCRVQGTDTQRIDGAETQWLYLEYADRENYFSSLISNNLQVDTILPTGPDSTSMDFRYVTLDTGTDGSNENQQLVTAIDPVGDDPITDANRPTATVATINGGTVNTVDIAPNPLGISVAEVIQANSESDFSMDIEEVNNKISWQIADGTRTGHFKPNPNGKYDPDGKYATNDANEGN